MAVLKSWKEKTLLNGIIKLFFMMTFKFTFFEKIKIFFALVFFLISCTCFANNLKTSTPILYLEHGEAYAVFNVSWDNGWQNSKNHDAIWLHFKSISNNGDYHHIKVAPKGHTMMANFGNPSFQLDFETTKDSIGVFIFSKNKFRGDVHVTVKIKLHGDDFKKINTRRSSFSVFGIEMVKIPEGGFELGDPSEGAQNYGSFYQPKSENDFSNLLTIDLEKTEIAVAKNGSLFYQKKEGYEGDQTGIIPAEYPKGVAAFYTMKYEITEGQYVDFLNSISTDLLQERIIINEKNYKENEGTIEQKENKFFTSFPNKPCQFLSWDDAMAFSDWSGLRPMTELEFTKAARGKNKAAKSKYPWGNDQKEKVQRLPNEDGVLVMNNGWSEEKLSEKNLVYFAASYYWVMDLSGSLWERVITVGHPNGRNFRGTHGDGILSSKGFATNNDWAKGEENSGGVGYRGGGFYGYKRGYHEYNPFSPIAFRPYGGWHGTSRAKAYGGRLVRTVD